MKGVNGVQESKSQGRKQCVNEIKNDAESLAVCKST